MYRVLWSKISSVTKQKGMQAADGLFPEIATMPEQSRAWAIPPNPAMAQAWPHCSPHGGQPGNCPSSSPVFLGYL